MRHFALIKFLAFTTSPDASRSSHVTRSVEDGPPLVRKLSSAVQPHQEKRTERTSPPRDEAIGRRRALQSIFAVTGGSSLALGGAGKSNALDMDAFINAELESDKKSCDPKTDRKCVKELSNDEGLCKYGSAGKARSEACKRVKEAGGDYKPAQQGGKSMGGAYAM